jgi:gag-polypeptide of LTR copia-type
MKSKIYEQYAYAPSAKALWDSLYEMYGQINNSSRVFELQQSILQLKQEDLTATEYLGEMKKLWDELQQYLPKAATVEEYEEREAEDKIFRVLANLSPDYEDIRREILMRDKMPSYTAICAIIQRAEAQGRVMKSKGKVSTQNSVETSAHYTSNFKPGNRERKGSRSY